MSSTQKKKQNKKKNNKKKKQQVHFIFDIFVVLILIYRRLSLSQSPGDQTKYFELSVVWDSQFATSFTLYMYADCLDHRDYNLYVHVFEKRRTRVEISFELVAHFWH